MNFEHDLTLTSVFDGPSFDVPGIDGTPLHSLHRPPVPNLLSNRPHDEGRMLLRTS